MRRAAVVLLTSVLAFGAAACESRADACRKQGGEVTSEREYDRQLRRTVTEYECHVDGQEVDEWR